MAKARLQEEPKLYKVILELSQDEAETLLGVTGGIGGDPETSRRKHTDSIRYALGRELGYDASAKVRDEMDGIKDIIYFKDQKEN